MIFSLPFHSYIWVSQKAIYLNPCHVLNQDYYKVLIFCERQMNVQLTSLEQWLL